jgi:hypothetical protein
METVVNYDAKLFVVPEEAHRWALAKVKRWKETQSQGSLKDRLWRARYRGSQAAPGDQVSGLVGERGVGKTWFLRHLAEDDGRVSPEAVYLDLEKRIQFPKPHDFVVSVEDQIRKRSKNGGCILLLDTVPPDLDRHLRALEDAILRPHVTQHGSLVFMALVHPSRVCWRAPVLRGGENYLLFPFHESQTRTQLQKLQKAGLLKNGHNAAKVQEYSGGHPLLNHLLATHEEKEAFESLLRYWFARIPTDERGRVLRYLEAVCVLDVLEHASIQRVLDAYDHYQPDSVRPRAHAGDVRTMLRKHWLARAAPNSPGRIVVVDSVRRAAKEVLKARDADLYAVLDRAAEVKPRGRG